MPTIISPKSRDAPKSSGYRLEDQIGFLLRKASQRHTAIFSNLFESQLTPTQWAALLKIRETGPCSQIELGRETAMDGATIKGVVDRLASRRLVEFTPDPGDGRRRIVSLTAAGKATVDGGIQTAGHISEMTLDSLTAGERYLLLELLHKIS